MPTTEDSHDITCEREKDKKISRGSAGKFDETSWIVKNWIDHGGGFDQLYNYYKKIVELEKHPNGVKNALPSRVRSQLS